MSGVEVSTVEAELVPLTVVEREPIDAPTGISKSMAKALVCKSFFTGQYLQPGTLSTPEHFLTRTGIEFHEWRKEYAEHLMREGKFFDVEFRDRYLDETPLSDDARKLISRDAFEIDPESVYGTELFLSVDYDFRPLEEQRNREPGLHSKHPDAYCWGTVDLLLLEEGGRVATVVDPKSGFSTTGVTDEEPVIYAALVFAHFPMVEEVHFKWDFVRVSALRKTAFKRYEDLRWMQDKIRELNAQKEAAVVMYNSGRLLDANPFSGLCPYCQISCPLRPRWEAGELALAMPQTREDAIRLSQLVKVCEDVLSRARGLVIQWLDQDKEGLDLGGGWRAALRVDQKSYYPLIEALLALGLDVVDIEALDPSMRDLVAQHRPEYSPLFDVPLKGLTVSGLNDYAKTKKSRKRLDDGGVSRGGVSREGMKSRIANIAKQVPSTCLVIRKSTQVLPEEMPEAS